MHLVPDDPKLWEIKRYDDFVKARQALLLERLIPILHELPDWEEAPDSPTSVEVEPEPETTEVDLPATTLAEKPAAVSQTPVQGKTVKAEGVLADFLGRIAPPSKYIAGFRTPEGRELALERESASITLWSEVLPGAEESGFLLHRRYDATKSRNTNLNGKNCPRLKLGNPVLMWKLADTDELLDFINWYQHA